MSWQRDNVQAAAGYLRERIAAGDNTPRARTLYEGLLEVLEPNRRAARLQREAHAAAKAAVAIKVERRARDRRRGADRRTIDLGSPTGVERRRHDRRSGRDRRDRPA
ncbi:MAG: hypothetical protein IT176_15035 [Acidobacteria bacterium]|nr:hypothetical protein [Acidobacteriota bacterium]